MLRFVKPSSSTDARLPAMSSPTSTIGDQACGYGHDKAPAGESQSLRVALLTGGGDKHYALGIASALTSAGINVDFIGSNDHNVPEVIENPRINFLNLRGDQRPETTVIVKARRVLAYYIRLITYAVTAKPPLFHILWHNKFQLFDRTLLLLFYKLLGKRLTFTAHNVNAGERDRNDSWMNQLTLWAQYTLMDHVFVHTERMKRELCSEFSVPKNKVSVIPFGINNVVPNTALSREEAKRRFGLSNDDRTLLFFGNIAPYKGLDCLITAFTEVARESAAYRLIIAGRPKGPRSYWRAIEQAISSSGFSDRIIQQIKYVPDEETELNFKAADVLVLPYTHIYQSGVLFLGYSFGLPVIASDVGSFREEIIEGKTGFMHKAGDSVGLERAIRTYFESDLYRNLDRYIGFIRDYANERHSWTTVGKITADVYSRLCAEPAMAMPRGD